MQLAEFDIGAATQITVTAPARLHLGFIDPAGTRGRRFGSLGLALERPVTRISMRSAQRDRFVAEPGTEGELERVREHVDVLRRRFRREAALEVRLHEVLPAHAGFGSGTQLALAVGRAFAELHAIEVASRELARLLGRGARSGIGIAAFDAGGLLLDCGPGRGSPAPVLARVAWPPAWRVLLVVDRQSRGLAGTEEARALAELAPLGPDAAARLAHAAIMQILPAAHEADFAPFARGVSELQRVLGDYFAPAQNGSRYTSAAVGRLIEWIGANAEAGVGQSSWGPTGFAFFPSQAAAQQALERARAAGVVESHLQLCVVGGRNRGASCIASP